MADPLSIITTTTSIIITLVDAFEIKSENRKEISKLMLDLNKTILEINQLRSGHIGNHEELDSPFVSLITKFVEIHTDCKALLPEPDVGLLKRTRNRVANVAKAKSVEKKLTKLREDILHAQVKFLVLRSVHWQSTGQNPVPNPVTCQQIVIKQNRVSQLQEDIVSLASSAEDKPVEARSTFGVPIETQKAEFRKATLDLESNRSTTELTATTLKKDQLFSIEFKIRTLRNALETGVLMKKSDKSSGIVDEYYPGPDDPFHKIHNNPEGTWRQPDALIETVALLDELRNPESMAETQALIVFIRANNLSLALRSLGLRKEALQLCLIVHDVIQTLSKNDCMFYRGYLAQSLVTLSACRSDVDDVKGALEAIEDAVKIYRVLVKGNLKKFELPLANSLNSLSVDLGAVGRREEALDAIQEVVGMYRKLASTSPLVHNPDLAMSLNNLSVQLKDVGKVEDALTAVGEAVKLYRGVAARNEAFNPELARSLNNLSKQLYSTGKRKEALGAIEEAVKIYRTYAATSPEAFSRDLAMSLNILSKQLHAAGKTEEALGAIEEAVQIYRLLAASRESTDHELASSLDILSKRFYDSGKEEDALSAIKESVKIRKALVKTNAEVFVPGLARSLYKLSVLLSKVGNKAEALETIQEAVDLHRGLFIQNPNRSRSSFSDALTVLGVCLKAVGQTEGAQAAWEEADQVKNTSNALLFASFIDFGIFTWT